MVCAFAMSLPMKWFLLISFRTDKYTENVIGTPCIFKIINGKRKRTNGIKKLRIGEPMLTTEMACRKDGILFNDRNTLNSI
jgi:hypothetical protein